MFTVIYRTIGVPGQYNAVWERRFDSWKEALAFACEQAYRTPQGLHVDVETPSGRNVAHMEGIL